MSTIITAEHFTLSEETRTEILTMLEKLNRIVPEDSQVRLFMKLEGKNELQATLTVHMRDGDMVYTESGDNLFPLIRSVKAHLIRQLVDRKEKRIHARKKSGRTTGSGAESGADSEVA